MTANQSVIPDRSHTRPSKSLAAKAGLLFQQRPFVAAAMLTTTSVCFILLVLRPGYWINDDVKIVWNLAGYPGYGAPTEFIIHNNILLGLVLAPLYGLHASPNWYVILLATTNALAIWAFLALGLAASYPSASTRLGLAVIVAGTSTLVLDVTYTVSAF